MSDPIGRGPLPSLTEEERGRLVMMAEKAEREVKGRRDAAEHHSAGGWWASVALGFFAPLIGIGVATGLAALTHPDPKTIPVTLDALCYRDAYGDRARTRNILTALGSSTVGTVLFILAIAISGGFVVIAG